MKAKLRCIRGSKPNGRTLKEFLRSIELRGKDEQCLWYGSSNCNYFVMLIKPYRGWVIEAFGYHADRAFERKQWVRICEEIRSDIAGLKALSEIMKKKEFQNLSGMIFVKKEYQKNAFSGQYFRLDLILDRIAAEEIAKCD